MIKRSRTLDECVTTGLPLIPLTLVKQEVQYKRVGHRKEDRNRTKSSIYLSNLGADSCTLSLEIGRTLKYQGGKLNRPDESSGPSRAIFKAETCWL